MDIKKTHIPGYPALHICIPPTHNFHGHDTPQFTLSSFLTLFTRPLTRHDPMLMSRNDSIQSKFNDSYGYFFRTQAF
jgi:hypothetical protein